MKLLFFVHAIVGGGAERVATILMNAYSSRGCVIILATDASVKPAYELNSSIKILDLRRGISKIERNIFDKSRRYYKVLRNARLIAKECNPDVVISFNTSLNHDVILALLGTKIPVVCCEHTNILYNHGFKTMIMRKLLYPFADVITVLTRHDYKIWRGKKNVVYMPNPIVLKKPLLNVQRQKKILAAGRLDIWKTKGFDTLIKCWGKICNDFSDWELHIAGKGSEKSVKFVERLIAENHANNVKLLGFCNNMHEIMSSSEVFCLTSRREGLPMVLLEAMNAGCCCVAYDCVTGPSDIILNGVNGILVENQNEEELVLSLRKILNSKDKREYLSSNTTISIAKFSIDRICNRWDILFSKLSRKKR